MENTRNAIRQGLSANAEPFTGNSSYNLGGTQGFKYLRDVGIVDAFPLADYVLPGNKGSRHNRAAFFLGGYSVSYKVTYVDVNRRIAKVSFSVHNRSSIESATRPPGLGYTKFWISITNNLNTESGPTSNIYQNFNWNETIRF
ncbi:hypothetical protein [Aquimarina aquimarini]|uniref:hypothetical protein n=1 Tax=Aquimarina aquimarini TaxID=1191734 RepID=UPI000D55156F|nr:hypothetical protein [Aquimarina aquimarini]